MAAIERAIRDARGSRRCTTCTSGGSPIASTRSRRTSRSTRGAHGTDVCKTVCQRLHDEFGLDHVTVQPEAPLPDELVNVRASRDGAPIRRVS